MLSEIAFVVATLQRTLKDFKEYSQFEEVKHAWCECGKEQLNLCHPPIFLEPFHCETEFRLFW